MQACKGSFRSYDIIDLKFTLGQKLEFCLKVRLFSSI